MCSVSPRLPSDCKVCANRGQSRKIDGAGASLTYRLVQVICVACTANVPSNLRSLQIVFAFVCLEVSCAGRRSRVTCTKISSLIAVFPTQFTTRAIIDLKFASCTGVQAAPKKDFDKQSIQLHAALKIRLRNSELHQIADL